MRLRRFSHLDAVLAAPLLDVALFMPSGYHASAKDRAAGAPIWPKLGAVTKDK